MVIQKEFPAISNIDDYKQMAYNIIKKPSKIYVETARDGNPYIAFFKEDIIVITSDNNMSISSMYKIKDSKWLKNTRKAIIRVY